MQSETRHKLGIHFHGHCADCTPAKGFQAEACETTGEITPLALLEGADFPALSVLLEDSFATGMDKDFEGFVMPVLTP